MGGYHGRYLRIDLSGPHTEWVEIPPDVRRKFLGGVGLGTWLLHQNAPAGVNPLAPEAAVVFCLGPLVGTPLTTSAKFAVVSRSPLTGRLNDALSSSHFALALRRTGADALVLVGACARPSVLVVEEDCIRLEDATDVWGLGLAATHERLHARLGPGAALAAIGPAGERLVRYATVGHESRHAGRGGTGAVLGAKRLKAIGLNGSRRVALADPAAVVERARELSRRSLGPATAKYRELGTVVNLLTFNRFAALPTRNFQEGSFEEAEELSGEMLHAAHAVTRRSCANCTIGCEHIFAGEKGAVRLEYESLFALGPLCGVSDRETVLAAARTCDDLGLDTISAGATIAFAMECAERGLLPEPHLRFGRADLLVPLLEQIARREGLGDLLAEGSRRVAAQLGGEAPSFAPHVKGLELPGYEPRALQTMALGFAVGSRGADHNRSGAYEADFSAGIDRLHGSTDSARLAVETEDRAALIDSLILCKFLRGVFGDLWAESAELLRPVTGWDIDGEELREVALRIVTLKKLYNLREGWTAAEDTLPERFLSQGLPAGGGADVRLPRERLQAMIQAYYHERGWSAEGVPTLPLLARLGLTELSPPGA